MKSLKSLLTLAIAMAVSSATLADTTNPLTMVKESAKTTLTEQTSQLKESASAQVNSTKQAVDSAKNSAKSTATDKMTSVKEEASSKVATMKQTATSAKSSITDKATSAKSEVTEKVAATKQAVSTAKNTVKKININKADAKTLQMLDGIGEAKAKAIIEYRNANGKIKNLAELSKVSGIGESTLEKVKSAISF